MKSSSPASAHWRSSKTSTVGASSASRSKKRPPGHEQLLALERRGGARVERGSRRRGSIQAPLVGSPISSASAAPSWRRATSASTSARRCGPTADHLAERPRRRCPRRTPESGRSAIRRSRHARRWHARAPRRGGSCRSRRSRAPMTSRPRPSAAVASNRSFSSRSSASRPTNGPGVTRGPATPRAIPEAHGQGRHRSCLALERSCPPTPSNAIAATGPIARSGRSSTSTPPLGPRPAAGPRC